jgi:hypothetical protein
MALDSAEFTLLILHWQFLGRIPSKCQVRWFQWGQNFPVLPLLRSMERRAGTLEPKREAHQGHFDRARGVMRAFSVR